MGNMIVGLWSAWHQCGGILEYGITQRVASVGVMLYSGGVFYAPGLHLLYPTANDGRYAAYFVAFSD